MSPHLFSGAMLRDIRKSAGLTQEQLSQRINLSVRTIRDIEGDKRHSIESLTLTTLRSWWLVCKPLVTPEQAKRFYSYLNKYFKY